MHEPALVVGAYRCVQAGVVGQRSVAVLVEGGSDLLGLSLGQTIDDAALALAGLEEAKHLLRRARLFGDAVADVGTVETGDKTVFSADLQMFDDLRPRSERSTRLNSSH